MPEKKGVRSAGSIHLGADAKPKPKAARRFAPPPAKKPGKKDKENEKHKEREKAGDGVFWVVPTRAQLKALAQGRAFALKDFKTGDCIGKGSFAFVRIVTLRQSLDETPTPLAMKTMSKMHLLASSQIQHVRAEKQILEQVDSPFIVTFLASFQDDRRLFFVLEYAHGGELFGRLSYEGRLPVDHAKFYAAELITVLQTLDQIGALYRDLKPENVLIDSDGHIKLCDFGFAKILMTGDKTYTIVGCPEYLAPEILKGVGHTSAVDFWALGVLIFEMLAGYPPFLGDNPYETYKKVMVGTVTFPRHFDVKAANLVSELLEDDTEKRGGVISCMKHCWFNFVEWQEVAERVVKPPYRPALDEPLDTRMFDLVPEEEAMDSFNDAQPVSRKAQKLFAGL